MRLSGSPITCRQIAKDSVSSGSTVAHSRSCGNPNPPSDSDLVSSSQANGIILSL